MRVSVFRDVLCQSERIVQGSLRFRPYSFPIKPEMEMIISLYNNSCSSNQGAIVKPFASLLFNCLSGLPLLVSISRFDIIESAKLFGLGEKREYAPC